LNVAQDQNLIQENSSLWERVQQVTAAVREGKTIEEAVAEVGVSTELVTRLVEMGQRSPFPAAELSL
jgi:type II secretory pathway component PulF